MINPPKPPHKGPFTGHMDMNDCPHLPDLNSQKSIHQLLAGFEHSIHNRLILRLCQVWVGSLVLLSSSPQFYMIFITPEIIVTSYFGFMDTVDQIKYNILRGTLYSVTYFITSQWQAQVGCTWRSLGISNPQHRKNYRDYKH